MLRQHRHETTIALWLTLVGDVGMLALGVRRLSGFFRQCVEHHAQIQQVFRKGKWMVDRRYEGIRFAVDRVVHDGRQRDIVRHPGAAVILPIVDADQICLIRNYRVAVDETLIELPAGTLEPNEPPEVTAARELTEETGYSAESVELLVQFYPSPGIMDERMFVYVATGLTEGPPEREAGEEIENLIVPLADAIAMIGDGRIKDGKTIAGLLYYERFGRRS